MTTSTTSTTSTALTPCSVPALRPHPRVLVVDDSGFVRRLMSHVLSQHGCLVETAVDGDSAVGLASQTRYDLVVIDRFLQGCDGLQTCTRLSRLPEGLRPDMLLCSAGYRYESEGKAAARACGATAYAPKDPGLKGLIETIHSLLQKNDVEVHS